MSTEMNVLSLLTVLACVVMAAINMGDRRYGWGCLLGAIAASNLAVLVARNFS